jgi:DNA-binding XRE family transcriptional regulator
MTYWTPEQFRQARHNLGLSQLALSRALDCGKRTIERCDADGCTRVMALAMERLNEGLLGDKLDDAHMIMKHEPHLIKKSFDDRTAE